MKTIREYYQEGNYGEIIRLSAGRQPQDYEDVMDVYRIGRAKQRSGRIAESIEWFRAYVDRNPVPDSYRRLLEACLQMGDLAGTEDLLKEMEGKDYFSDYYYAAKYELAKLRGESAQVRKEILSEMMKECKIAYYMIALAVLHIRADEQKEAGKILKKVRRLYDGEDAAEYAVAFLKAIESQTEKEFVEDQVYSGEGVFGRICPADTAGNEPENEVKRRDVRGESAPAAAGGRLFAIAEGGEESRQEKAEAASAEAAKPEGKAEAASAEAARPAGKTEAAAAEAARPAGKAEAAAAEAAKPAGKAEAAAAEAARPAGKTEAAAAEAEKPAEETERDLSFMYEEKRGGQSEGSASGPSLMELWGSQRRKANVKKMQQEDETIPDCIVRSMEDVYGFREVREMLSVYYDMLQHEKSVMSFLGKTEISHCFCIKGGSGSGVSRAAQVIADTLFRMGLLDSAEIVTVYNEDIVGVSSDEIFQNIQDLFQNSIGKLIHFDHLEDYYSESYSPGMEAIGYLEKAIRQSRDQTLAVVISGDGANFDKLLKSKKKFGELFKDRVTLEPFTAEELRDILNVIAMENGYMIQEDSKGTLLKLIKRKMKEPEFESLNTLKDMLEEAKRNLVKRIKKKKIKREVDSLSLLEEDFQEGEEEVEDVEVCLERLNDMIGLKEVKQEVAKIIGDIQGQLLEKELCEKSGKTYTPSDSGLNLLFVGNPGTGKTTVARLLADIYRCLGVLPKGQLVEVSRSQLVEDHVGGSAKATRAKFNEAIGGVLFVDEAYTLRQSDSDTFGSEALDELLKDMEDNKGNVMVIMAGYEDKMNDLIEHGNEGLKSRMKTVIHFEDYSPDDMVVIFKQILAKSNKKLMGGLDQTVRALLAERSQDPKFGNARGVRNLVEEVISLQRSRISAMRTQGEQLVESDIEFIRKEDVEKLIKGEIKKTKSVQELLKELDDMTGLAGVKKKVHSIVRSQEGAKERAKRGLKNPTESSLHLVFQGPPGTGKTTVARMIGEIYKELGVLRRGQVIEKQPADLIGDHIGNSGKLMNEAVKDAMGGILFIDEAYGLLDHGSYSDEAITALLTAMENNRDDLMVIVAGYPEQIEKLLDSNPGFRSRFSTFIDFENYSNEELLEILRKRVRKEGYLLGQEAERKMLPYFEEAAKRKDFGNAREVRKALEGLLAKQGDRLFGNGDKDVQDLTDQEIMTITTEDVDAFLSGKIKASAKKKSVDELLSELHGLIGLSSVKAKVDELVAVAKVNQAMMKAGEKARGAGFLHMVFQGSAGTGKTTVARIIGEIYNGLGFLSSGHTVTATYADLVSEYQADTPRKTREVIQKAMGGVLFIDEAYTLLDSEPGRKGHGQEAIDELLTAMVDYKDFMIIAAGYREPMQRFLDSNEGLRSRFPNVIDFEDYSTEELMTIFRGKMRADAVSMDEETEKLVYRCLEIRKRSKSFGNARGVGNLYAELMNKIAVRVAGNGGGGFSLREAKTILPEDIYAAEPSLLAQSE